MTLSLPALQFGGEHDDRDSGAAGQRRFRVLGLEDARSPEPLATDDHALVERLRAGDDRAFLELWHAHAARLADVAYRYLRSADAAADVVQQTFIALWESHETLHVHTSIANFLYGAVRNRATNTLAHDRVVREHRERVAAEYDLETFAVQNEGARAIDVEELAAHVRSIVDTLPVRTREIFLMSREDGLAPSEIAAVLGLSAQTVYNQLARAVRTLAEGLAEGT